MMSPHLVVFFAGLTAREQSSADLLAGLSGVTLLRTDERGTVEVVVEGARVGARSQR